MALTPCDSCGCIPGNMSSQDYHQRVVNILCDILSASGGTGVVPVTSCLEVTSAGAWGSIGDRITETRWYDTSTNPPTLLSTTYFNEDTQAVVTGVTSGNTQPCPGADIGESCINPMFINICDVSTPANLGLYAEDSVATTGWRGQGVLGVSNEALTAKAAVNDDYTQFSTTSKGVVLTNIDSGGQIAQATGLLKLEDSLHVSGDAGVQTLGVVQTLGAGTQTILSSTSLDYVPGAQNLYGGYLVDIQAHLRGNSTTSPVRLEDEAFADANAVIMTGTVRNTTLGGFGGTDQDVQPLASGIYGQALASLVLDTNLLATSTPIRPEDAAVTDGQALMMAGAVNNNTRTAFNSTSGDATPVGVNNFGAVLVNLDATCVISAGNQPVRLEDAAFSDQDAVMMAGAVYIANPGQGAGTTGDVTAFNTNPQGALYVQDLVSTTNGLTPSHLVSAGSNNATSLKGSAGQLYMVAGFNLNAAPAYLKFYNVSGTPNPASDTVVHAYMIPGNTAGAGLVLNIDKGIAFSAGIGYAIVTGIGDTNNTGVAANEVVVDFGYK